MKNEKVNNGTILTEFCFMLGIKYATRIKFEKSKEYSKLTSFLGKNRELDCLQLNRKMRQQYRLFIRRIKPITNYQKWLGL